ncbi:hypothetical protein J6590_050484 [Homalodisca vitripennis]|nr:hypothetical protein J6590_050484 [Homalodisca vitripennis]
MIVLSPYYPQIIIIFHSLFHITVGQTTRRDNLPSFCMGSGQVRMHEIVHSKIDNTSKRMKELYDFKTEKRIFKSGTLISCAMLECITDNRLGDLRKL